MYTLTIYIKYRTIANLRAIHAVMRYQTMYLYYNFCHGLGKRDLLALQQ